MIIRPTAVIRCLLDLFSTNLLVAAIHVFELDTVSFALHQLVIEVQLPRVKLRCAAPGTTSVTGLSVN